MTNNYTKILEIDIEYQWISLRTVKLMDKTDDIVNASTNYKEMSTMIKRLENQKCLYDVFHQKIEQEMNDKIIALKEKEQVYLPIYTLDKDTWFCICEYLSFEHFKNLRLSNKIIYDVTLRLFFNKYYIASPYVYSIKHINIYINVSMWNKTLIDYDKNNIVHMWKTSKKYTKGSIYCYICKGIHFKRYCCICDTSKMKHCKSCNNDGITCFGICHDSSVPHCKYCGNYNCHWGHSCKSCHIKHKPMHKHCNTCKKCHRITLKWCETCHKCHGVRPCDIIIAKSLLDIRRLSRTVTYRRTMIDDFLKK